MAQQVRVFVSHHHGPEEDKFTARLVADLEAAGADVWVDDQRINSNNFVQKISEGLEGRQWLVLVMTPQSVASPWVRNEVNTALSEHTAGRMLGVIPIVMTPTPEEAVPVLWRPLHRYDATSAYESARDGLLGALDLSLPKASAVPQPAVSASKPTPVPFRLPGHHTPRYPMPDVPARLASLGFRGVNVNGAQAIVPPLITIPAGPFLMGSDKAKDSQARDSELPQHRVEVAAFQIATYPVTVAEYAFAVRAGAVREPPAYEHVDWRAQQQHLDHPVVCVSWQDAMAYIAWLHRVAGQRGWRLPTEAEWEKAARWDSLKRTSRIYPWGDHYDKTRCNTSDSDNRTTVRVGSYPASDARHSGASPYGVEEMSGNVWVWTSSLHQPYPYVPTDGREHPSAYGERAGRGSSFLASTDTARTAHRRRMSPTIAYHVTGFRLAFTPVAGS